jgi:Domain of unknown function (DUF4124)
MVALACAAIAAPAQAQWKWRDGKGQMVVSDTPPPRDVPDKDVLQRPDPAVRKPASASAPAAAPASAALAAAAKPAVDPELEERRRRAEQEQATRNKAEEKKTADARKDNCQRARDQVALLESGQRIARIKPDGERDILDDEGRAREMQRARDAIKADCR